MKLPVRHTLAELIAMDGEQASQRIKMGDALGEKRVVEHFAFFKGTKGAVTAAAELDALGYRTLLARQGFGHVRLEARIYSDVEEPTTDAFVRDLFALIERHGGFYDGYSAPVILKGTPS